MPPMPLGPSQGGDRRRKSVRLERDDARRKTAARRCRRTRTPRPRRSPAGRARNGAAGRSRIPRCRTASPHAVPDNAVPSTPCHGDAGRGREHGREHGRTRHADVRGQRVPSPLAARLVPYGFARSGQILRRASARRQHRSLDQRAHERRRARRSRAQFRRAAVVRMPADELAAGDQLRPMRASDGSAAQVVGEVEGDVDLSRMMQDLPAIEDLLESADDAPIIRMINALLTQAARERRSGHPHRAVRDASVGALSRRRHAARRRAAEQGAARAR